VSLIPYRLLCVTYSVSRKLPDHVRSRRFITNNLSSNLATPKMPLRKPKAVLQSRSLTNANKQFANPPYVCKSLSCTSFAGPLTRSNIPPI